MIKTCPRCGANMIEKPPAIIYLSEPPQWDRVMWCGCGYQENLGRVIAPTQEENLRDKWGQANPVFINGIPRPRQV